MTFVDFHVVRASVVNEGSNLQFKVLYHSFLSKHVVDGRNGALTKLNRGFEHITREKLLINDENNSEFL